jgi:uncharacterized glyoxalase superfamily protein PhnB
MMIPFIRYDDAPAAVRFLTDAFGFEQKLVVPGDEGTIAHAELTYGKGMVMIGSTRDDDFRLKTPHELGAATQGVYVIVEDPDAHHDRAKVAGAEIVYGLVDQEYGSREYGARDLEGHLWTFGTYDPFAQGAG